MPDIPEIKAWGTERPNNRFSVPLYLRVTPEGTVEPVSRAKRRAAHFKVTLEVEYPSYEEDLRMREAATRYEPAYHSHRTNQALLTEARLRRCLAKWDLHDVLPVPGLDKLQRKNGELLDESMDQWKRLPPLVRDAVAYAVNRGLGG